MDIVEIEQMNYIENLGEKYFPLVQNIQEYLPIIAKDTNNFNKTQSNFMDNILTVSHKTPLRNIRQILAEIKKSKQALEESYFGAEKQKIEIKKLKRKLESETDDLEVELINIEIAEKENQLINIKDNQAGAIRKISGYIEQIKSIKKKYNLNDFTEQDFENEEEKYHIKKAFEQAICAARSKNGIIDEGNFIYLNQLGINGAVAQDFITKLFVQEKEIIKSGSIPSSSFIDTFLDEMYRFFSGCSGEVLKNKGMIKSEISILK